MANRLSDDDLRRSLQEYGEDVGPITPTTRSIWEKRLLTLRKNNGPSPKRTSLNAFSSDDSEIESAVSSRVRKKRTINRNESSERLNLNRSRELNSSPDSDVFKKPSPVHIPILGQGHKTQNDRSLLHRNHHNKVKTRKSLGRSAPFDVETSDSDFDADTSYVHSKSLRYRKKSSSPAPVSSLLGVSLKRHSDGTNYDTTLQRKSFCSTGNTDHKPLYHFSTIQNKSKQDISDHGFRTNGYLTNTISNGDFHEEKVQGSSTNYSHCISWMLLIGGIIFFVVIGTLYMTEIKKSSQSANKNYLKFCGNMDQEKCNKLISISKDLHLLLTTVAGDYECDTSGLIKSRNLTVLQARLRLYEQVSDENIKQKEFQKLFYHSLNLVLQNPDWGIKWYSPTAKSILEITSIQDASAIDSSALEATQAAKSLWCRVRLSLQWTTSRLLMLCTIIFMVFLSYIGLNLWKKRREAQEKMFYEMVEKVIDILQEPQDSSYQPDSNLGPYKAVVNIRDSLISPKERKEKLSLWDKVVAFIEENESRVSVEYKKINGEDFKVWRWHPSTSSENDGGKQGKVWQGQAFNSLGKGKSATYSPTPCLKIRNMFDSEVEYGDDWQVNIRDAILEKCEGNEGIRHIAIDTSSTEGCVYMLCISSDAAGKAFNALHGWWFDGKLVTVKYIRYERYLERFPAAENCVEPLKPSNNMRLSLSTPFFSSALERS